MQYLYHTFALFWHWCEEVHHQYLRSQADHRPGPKQAERESTRTALPEQLFAIHPCWLPRSDCLYNMRLLCLLRRGGRGRLPRRPLLDQQPFLYTHLDIIIAPVAGAGAFLPLPESLRRPEAQSRVISSTVQTCGSTRYQHIQCSRTSKR